MIGPLLCSLTACYEMPWLCTSSKKSSKTKVSGLTQRSRDEVVIANGRPSFAVVLQNFAASVGDELSVQRGQVVETLYTDSSWVYVRDLDGKCGYAPDEFCQSLDHPGANQWTCKAASPKMKPRQKSIHLERNLQHSNSLASVELNFVSQNSGSVPSSSCTTPSSQRSHTAAAAAAAGSTARTEDREQHQQQQQQPPAASAPQTSQENVATTPTATTLQAASEAVAVPRTLAFRSSSGRSHSAGGTPMEPTPNVQNHPLLNRAMSYQEATTSTTAERYSLAPAATPPAHTPDAAHTTAGGRPEQAQECDPEGNDDDDVFENKNNMGIYYSRQNYKPRFKGEISLRLNELVIVSEGAKGEWAWVITSSSSQGLVPKHILSRYQPGSFKPQQADAATQTELIVSGVTLDASRPPPRGGGEEEPPWFKHNDSLERPAQRRVSSRRAPPSSTVREPRVQAVQQHERLMGAIGFEPEYDSTAQLRGQRRARQTPVLTVTRDYHPPATAKNCLLLTKGDILYSQPHMHYPKGWMWVWHSTQRSFGYVPKNHVAYMYLVQKGNRQNQQHTQEDAV